MPAGQCFGFLGHCPGLTNFLPPRRDVAGAVLPMQS